MERPPVTFALDAFDLDRRLGWGGMGEVWAGRHRASGRPVAVKVITDGRAREPRYQAAFRNEVRAVAGLDHPYVVQVLDHGQVSPATEAASGRRLAAHSPYLVMERLDGGSLRDRRAWTWPAARGLLLALLDAFAHAHARGVIHRDLKPDNVLWSAPDGVPRLTDFGVAHALEPDGEDAHGEATVGTPDYMAPEQIRCRTQELGPWTDLYALGCLAFELLCGRVPYVRDRGLATLIAHLYDPVPRVEACFAVPEGIEGWVRRLLSKAPADRYQCAADAAWALRRLGGGDDGSTTRVLQPLVARPASTMSWVGLVPDTVVEMLASAATMDVSGADLEATAPTLDGSELDLEAPPAAPAPSLGPLAPPGTPPPVPPDWRGVAVPTRPDLLGVGLGLVGLRAVPMVGRDAERDLLWQQLRGVVDGGRAAAVALTGPAGYGKSRLAAWLGERAQELGAAQVLRATHTPLKGPAHGLGPMLGRFLRCRGLRRADLLARVDEALRALDLTDPGDALTIAELVSPTTEEERTGGRWARFTSPTEAYAVLYRFLAALAARRPVVLWLDDVQWGLTSLTFAAHLLDRQDQQAAPILLAVTARDEAMAEHAHVAESFDRFIARPEVTRVPVGPLDTAARPRLLAALAGLAPEVVRRVDARTGGNPLFAVQLIGDWVQRGVLAPAEGGIRIRPGAEALAHELPADLRDVWADRIARLLDGRAPGDGVALELAAVLGQEVEPAEWTAACALVGVNPDTTLVEALLVASLATLDGGGPRWGFVHNMLRESLEARARDAGRWAAHHRTCATMLAARPAPGVAERVARHLLAAGDPDAAAEPLARAAAEALDAGDYPAAAELIGRHDEALAGAPEADPRHGEGWLLRARLGRLAGHLEQATTFAGRAVEAAAAHGWAGARPRAYLELGALTNDHGLHAQAEAWLGEGAALAAAAGDEGTVARCRLALGDALYRLGRTDDAFAAYAAARAAFDTLGDADGQGRASLSLARVEKVRRNLPEARRHTLAARASFEPINARNALGACANQLGELHRLAGELPAAEAQYREALRQWRAIGAGNVVFAEANLALVLLESDRPGCYPEGRRLLEAALARFVATGRHAMAAVAHACLLPALADDDDWFAFDRHLAEAERLLSRTGVADVDAARLTQRAAELAAAVGERHRARAAWKLAATQWRALDRMEEAAYAEERA